MENINGFLEITIVGAVLSAIVEGIKRKYGTESSKTRLLTIVLSCVFGGVYMYLRATPWWEAIGGVLAAASTVYALVIPKAKG